MLSLALLVFSQMAKGSGSKKPPASKKTKALKAKLNLNLTIASAVKTQKIVASKQRSHEKQPVQTSVSKCKGVESNDKALSSHDMAMDVDKEPTESDGDELHQLLL